MLGKDLLIASNGRVIAGQVDCQLNITQKTLEVCSPVSGEWEEHIPTTLGWSVTVNGLIISPEHADELIDIISARQKLRISFYDPELRIVRSGYTILTNLGEGASLRELTSQSLEFLGSGALEKVKYSNWQEFDDPIEIDDVAYNWVDDKHHPVIHLQEGITIMKLEVNSVCRIIIDTFQQHACLYMADADEVHDRIQKEDNIWLYQHEVAHLMTDGHFHIDSLLLMPGTYCIALNGIYEELDFYTPAYKTLSLPTE